MNHRVYEVHVEQDEDGRWAAWCPTLPGCATWGETREEVERNIRAAVEAYVEDASTPNDKDSESPHVHRGSCELKLAQWNLGVRPWTRAELYDELLAHRCRPTNKVDADSDEDD